MLRVTIQQNDTTIDGAGTDEDPSRKFYGCYYIGEYYNGKTQRTPKYNVLSIRVTDEEKALFEKMKRNTRKNISVLIREAMHLHSPSLDVATDRSQ